VRAQGDVVAEEEVPPCEVSEVSEGAEDGVVDGAVVGVGDVDPSGVG